MARPDFPLNIDRRRLMTAAATVTTTAILPGVKFPDVAAAADGLQPPPRTASSRTYESFRCNGSASFGNRLPKRTPPGSKFAFAFDCEGTAPDEEAGRTGGVRPVRGGPCQGGVGPVAQALSRSGRQPKLAAELDGGCQLSKRGLQNSMGAILRARRVANLNSRSDATEIASRSQSNLMAT
jgi:hypothetical protein